MEWGMKVDIDNQKIATFHFVLSQMYVKNKLCVTYL